MEEGPLLGLINHLALKGCDLGASGPFTLGRRSVDSAPAKIQKVPVLQGAHVFGSRALVPSQNENPSTAPCTSAEQEAAASLDASFITAALSAINSVQCAAEGLRGLSPPTQHQDAFRRSQSETSLPIRADTVQTLSMQLQSAQLGLLEMMRIWHMSQEVRDNNATTSVTVLPRSGGRTVLSLGLEQGPGEPGPQVLSPMTEGAEARRGMTFAEHTSQTPKSSVLAESANATSSGSAGSRGDRSETGAGDAVHNCASWLKEGARQQEPMSSSRSASDKDRHRRGASKVLFVKHSDESAGDQGPDATREPAACGVQTLEGDVLPFRGSTQECSRVVLEVAHEESVLRPSHDGHHWRRYGRKIIKDAPYPRLYYKCMDEKCDAKKHMQIVRVDKGSLGQGDKWVTTVSYENDHFPLCTKKNRRLKAKQSQSLATMEEAVQAGDKHCLHAMAGQEAVEEDVGAADLVPRSDWAKALLGTHEAERSPLNRSLDLGGGPDMSPGPCYSGKRKTEALDTEPLRAGASDPPEANLPGGGQSCGKSKPFRLFGHSVCM